MKWLTTQRRAVIGTIIQRVLEWKAGERRTPEDGRTSIEWSQEVRNAVDMEPSCLVWAEFMTDTSLHVILDPHTITLISLLAVLYYPDMRMSPIFSKSELHGVQHEAWNMRIHEVWLASQRVTSPRLVYGLPMWRRHSLLSCLSALSGPEDSSSHKSNLALFFFFSLSQLVLIFTQMGVTRINIKAMHSKRKSGEDQTEVTRAGECDWRLTVTWASIWRF